MTKNKKKINMNDWEEIIKLLKHYHNIALGEYGDDTTMDNITEILERHGVEIEYGDFGYIIIEGD